MAKKLPKKAAKKFQKRNVGGTLSLVPYQAVVGGAVRDQNQGTTAAVITNQLLATLDMSRPLNVALYSPLFLLPKSEQRTKN